MYVQGKSTLSSLVTINQRYLYSFIKQISFSKTNPLQKTIE